MLQITVRNFQISFSTAGTAFAQNLQIHLQAHIKDPKLGQSTVMRAFQRCIKGA